MIWPFLMIYVSEKLEAPLTVAASLMTLNSIAGLFASFAAGPVIDRLGRKWIMVGSLVVNGLAYLFLSDASALPAFAIMMAISGAAQPLYRIGGDAMLADLVKPDDRAEGYALLRMSNNLGVALGPAIGGFLASNSYSVAFYFAAAGMTIYSILLAFFASETLPDTRKDDLDKQTHQEKERFGGYITIFKDRKFIGFTFAYTLVIICTSLIWVILPVYAKQNYGVTEDVFGFIPTTNALMVVFLQIMITRYTKRYPSLPVVTIGAMFYTVALGSVAFGGGFWGFWISMVIMTIGELIIVPTANTYAANLAPPDKRGRYMSIFGLSWRVAIGSGPILGGILNDNLGPKAIWYGGAVVGILSVFSFLLLARNGKNEKVPMTNILT